MELLVEQSKNLEGKVKIAGCKNSLLPILAACLLTKKEVVLLNVPNISDVEVMCRILTNMGAYIHREGDMLVVCCKDVTPGRLSMEDMSMIRGSSLVLGPLLARMRYAKLTFPGGCSIGSRPIDLHLDGVRRLGAKVNIIENIITVTGNLKPVTVRLDFPSVGATENLIMASMFTSGYTKIENAAREPEIYDLCKFLNQIGGRIYGHGTDTVIIEGVRTLFGGVYTPMPDRIEAGTYMIAACGCGGDVVFENVNPRHLNALTSKLRQMGINISTVFNSIRIKSRGSVFATNIICMPHPAFPTDLQAPMCSLMAIGKGTSIVTDKVFSSRFIHTKELMKMGANIYMEGNAAKITGVSKLVGCHVEAKDLRGGAALMVAGMFADGQTSVSGVKYIERGYGNYVEKFTDIGANIKKVY